MRFDDKFSLPWAGWRDHTIQILRALWDFTGIGFKCGFLISLDQNAASKALPAHQESIVSSKMNLQVSTGNVAPTF